MKENSKNFQEKLIAQLVKTFLQEYFFMSLEDESEVDIAKKVVKLFSEISKDSLKYLTTLKEFKLNMKFNIPFPCKISDKVDYDSSSDENESGEESDKNEENTECVDCLNKDKKIKVCNTDVIPELLDEEFINGCNLNNNNDDDDGFVEVSNKTNKKKKK